MNKARWSILSLGSSLLLAALSVLLAQSKPYAVVLLCVSGGLVLVSLIWTVVEYVPLVLCDPIRPGKRAERIYSKAASNGGTIHATHVFPLDRDPNNDFALGALADTEGRVNLSFSRILLLDSLSDEHEWLHALFTGIPGQVGMKFYLLNSYPLLLPRIAKALLPRLNLLLYESPSGLFCESLIGLDRLHIMGKEVNFAISSRSRRMYRVLRNYFDHITDSGHFRHFGNFQEYTASQRLSSSVERGQAVVSRLVDFAETTPGVQFIGIFGSMARAALGFVPEPMPERTDADVDILLIYSAQQLAHSIEETQRSVEQLLDPNKTKVTWGPDLGPFYNYRDDERVDVDIECLEARSRFYVSNRLLGYSVFRFFMPLYSADRLAIASYIGIPSVPLSESQRWAILECDRQGLRSFMKRLAVPQDIPETDPRRLASQMVRNLVWALTGIWSPTANEAIAYLQGTNDWRGSETIQRVKQLLQADTHTVRSSRDARLDDVRKLGEKMLTYGEDRKLIPANKSIQATK